MAESVNSGNLDLQIGIPISLHDLLSGVKVLVLVGFTRFVRQQIAKAIDVMEAGGNPPEVVAFKEGPEVFGRRVADGFPFLSCPAEKTTFQGRAWIKWVFNQRVMFAKVIKVRIIAVEIPSRLNRDWYLKFVRAAESIVEGTGSVIGYLEFWRLIFGEGYHEDLFHRWQHL